VAPGVSERSGRATPIGAAIVVGVVPSATDGVVAGVVAVEPAAPVVAVVPAASGYDDEGCPAASEQAGVARRQTASEQARTALAHGFVT